MRRSLTHGSTLESLKTEAKRWLGMLRGGDAPARLRLQAVLPDAPAQPGLGDVQFALAREHGLAGWDDLRQALDDLALARRSLVERVDIPGADTRDRRARNTASGRFFLRSRTTRTRRLPSPNSCWRRAPTEPAAMARGGRRQRRRASAA